MVGIDAEAGRRLRPRKFVLEDKRCNPGRSMRFENRRSPSIVLSTFVLTMACNSNSTRRLADGGSGELDGGALDPGTDTGDAPSGQDGATAQPSAGEMFDACMTFQMAQCQRVAECGRSSGNCLSSTLECPDSLFSPGSRWTAPLAKECAKQFATLPCEAALQGRSPVCAPSGTRAAGETCTSDFQCKSQTCNRGTQCGTCAADAKDGDTCASNTPCPVGSYCDRSSVCAPFPTGTTVPVPPARDAGATLPTLGMPCQETLACDGGSYCDGKTCLALPGKNELCGTSAQTGRPTWCAEGLYCDWKTTAFCRQLPIAGEDCAVGLDSTPASVNWLCASGLLCYQGTNPPACRSYEYLGCKSSADCGGALVCACPNSLQVFCRSQSCYDLRVAGQACDPTQKPCHPAFTCENGTCVARASQGVFAGLCKE